MNKLKYYNLSKHIPIITDEALNYIKEIIKEKNFKSMLEIGTAYGYSSIMLSDCLTYIETIEVKEDYYKEAVKQITMANKENTIKPRLGDGLVLEPLINSYDLIFIDAAKGKYEDFFNKYKKYLSEEGLIITDNINFHNLDLKYVSKQTIKLIKKIEKFKEFLINNEDFETTFLNIGDGLSISKRKRTN